MLHIWQLRLLNSGFYNCQIMYYIILLRLSYIILIFILLSVVSVCQLVHFCVVHQMFILTEVIFIKGFYDCDLMEFQPRLFWKRNKSFSDCAHIQEALFQLLLCDVFDPCCLSTSFKKGDRKSARLSRRVEPQLEEFAVARSFVSFLLVLFCRGIEVKIRSPGHF